MYVSVCSVNHIRRWVAEIISSLAINLFVFYMEVGLETLLKEFKLGENSFWKKIQVRHGPEKGHKQGRDRETEKQYPTTE